MDECLLFEILISYCFAEYLIYYIGQTLGNVINDAMSTNIVSYHSLHCYMII